jgi:transmembrane sensor
MQDSYDKEHLQELAHKWVEGTISPEELLAYNTWYDAQPDDLLELTEGYAANPLVIRDRVHTRLLDYIGKDKKVKLWPKLRWVGVAAALLITVAAGLLIYQNQNGQPRNQILAAQDIAPGKNGATLTLANGKKINLAETSDGALLKDAGISITKTKDGELVYQAGASSSKNQINTLSTSKGETYQVRLPDGTRVWLNAASSLTYASSLTVAGKRNVELNGEAYFEVAKDKTHPFVVQTKGQEVEVLGTHFNVSSYDNALATQTTLLEGSVRVSAGTDAAAVLKPGQQSVLRDGDRIQVKSVDVNEAVAWKDGYFRFYEVDLETFMNTIARWYDIDVVYEGGIAQYKDLAFGGAVSRSKNISEVLKILAQTGKVSYRVEGKKVTISKE